MRNRKLPVFLLAVVSCVPLLTCQEYKRTGDQLARKRDAEQELAYAQQFCSTEPLVGSSSGLGLVIDAKYKELEAAHATLSIDSYHRLSQQLLNYRAEWEVLHQAYKAACHRDAICLYRNSDMERCKQASLTYQDQQRLVNDFMLRLRQIDVATPAKATDQQP